MKWIKTEYKKPEFGVPVLVWCRIWGRGIYTYERIDPDLDWGNWHNGTNSGCLPPEYWMNLPLPPEPF